MYSTHQTAAAYAATLIVVLFWYALLQVGCLCDRQLAAAVKAGERIDHLDDEMDRLGVLHARLFGADE